MSPTAQPPPRKKSSRWGCDGEGRGGILAVTCATIAAAPQRGSPGARLEGTLVFSDRLPVLHFQKCSPTVLFGALRYFSPH